MLKKPRRSRVVLYCFIFVIGMSLFGVAMVPLYDTICEISGLNGKTAGPVGFSNNAVRDRTVTVEFVATTNANLPWKFYALVNKINIHPGENKRVAFFVENNSTKTITVQAIPSVTPGIAAKFLRKTECFCFRRQTLKSGETLDMPVIFHLDPELPRDIKTLTLSYTLFEVK